MPRLTVEQTRQLKARSRSKPTEEQPPAAVAVADVPEPVRPEETPPPPAPKRAVSEILKRRAEEVAVLVVAVEETLIALASDHTLSADEHSLLSSVGLVGERREGEVRRMKRIVARQAKAGTAGDREQARQDAEQAAAKLAERGPTIDAEILTLQTERAGLDATAEETRRACEQQEEAVKILRTRNFLPEHLRAEFDDLRSQVQTFSPKLQELNRELAHTEVLAQMEVSDNTVIDHAEQKRLPCFIETVSPHDKRQLIRSVNEAGWQQYIEQRREEDKQRRIELAETEAEIAPLNEQREALLSHYVPA